MRVSQFLVAFVSLLAACSHVGSTPPIPAVPITITTTPDGAEIRIDSNYVGVAPVTTRVMRRRAMYGPATMSISAATEEPGTCKRSLVLLPDHPTPDSIAFDLRACVVDTLGIYAIGLDSLAQLTVPMMPDYPDHLRRCGIEGKVVAEVVIDRKGNAEPENIILLEATNLDFARAAEDAVRRSVYRPGILGGVAVRTLVHIPINFGIRGGPFAADPMCLHRSPSRQGSPSP